MKIIFRQSFLLALIFFVPQLTESAVSRQFPAASHAPQSAIGVVSNDLGNVRHLRPNQKKGVGVKKMRLKERICNWLRLPVISMPTGKLLTSIILLVLSIVLLAVGGATKYGWLFGILGSVAIIGAVIAFLLWLSERSKTVQNTN